MATSFLGGFRCDSSSPSMSSAMLRKSSSAGRLHRREPGRSRCLRRADIPASRGIHPLLPEPFRASPRIRRENGLCGRPGSSSVRSSPHDVIAWPLRTPRRLGATAGKGFERQAQTRVCVPSDRVPPWRMALQGVCRQKSLGHSGPGRPWIQFFAPISWLGGCSFFVPT
jgi:hypothetical protein